jgi:hypothetical protein
MHFMQFMPCATRRQSLNACRDSSVSGDRNWVASLHSVIRCVVGAYALAPSHRLCKEKSYAETCAYTQKSSARNGQEKSDLRRGEKTVFGINTKRVNNLFGHVAFVSVAIFECRFESQRVRRDLGEDDACTWTCSGCGTEG